MDANVVAIDVVRHLLVNAGLKFEADLLLQLGKESLGCPTLAQKKVLHAGTVTALAQYLLVAEYLDHTLSYCYGLVRPHKAVQLHGQVRFGGEAAAHAKGEANLGSAANSGERDVVDLRIRAPDGAAGDAYLELARQVEECGIGGEQVSDLNRNGRSIDQLIVGNSGKRAPGDVAHH